jgi:hypothetical protein
MRCGVDRAFADRQEEVVEALAGGRQQHLAGAGLKVTGQGVPGAEAAGGGGDGQVQRPVRGVAPEQVCSDA